MGQGDGIRDETTGWNPYEPVASDPGGAVPPPAPVHVPAASTVAEPYAGYTSPQAPSPYATAPSPPSPYATSPYPAGPPVPPGTDGVSIAALVTGLLGMGPIPLILGIVGVSRTNRSGQQGKGFAVAGIVLGGLVMVGWAIVIVLAMAIGSAGQSGAFDDVRDEISQSTAQTYGDDPTLDGLYDSCAGGDDYACDDLYWESAPGSEYEDFALSCGGRGDRCLLVVGEG